MNINKDTAGLAKITDRMPITIQLVRLVSWGVVLTILIIVGRRLVSDWNLVDWRTISLETKHIGPAVASALLSNLMIVDVWKQILGVFNFNISFKSAFRIQLVSQIGKYIPGKVGLVFTKVVECRKIGLPAAESVTASSYEVLFGLYFQLIVCSATLPFFVTVVPWIDLYHTIFLLALVLLGFVFLRPRIYARLINFFSRITGTQLIEMTIRWTQWIRILLSLSVLAITNGLMAFFVVNIFHDTGMGYLGYITGATAWAFLLGMANLVAPSGIGVREGVLITLYSAIMPAPLALAAAVTSRLLVTVVEWSLIGTAFCIKPETLNIGK